MDQTDRTTWPDPPVIKVAKRYPWRDLAIVLLIIGFFVAVFWPPFYSRERARSVNCMSNIKQSLTGFMMYAQDYDGLLPRRDWMDNVNVFVKRQEVFTCTEVYRQNNKNFGHAFETTLAGKDVEKVVAPSLAPLVYDSRLLQKNASAPIREGIAKPGRHEGKNNIGFVDGHVKRLYNADLAALRH